MCRSGSALGPLIRLLFQFLNPAMLDRRQRLLPVLTTLLRLSPEEVAILKDTAPGRVFSVGVSYAYHFHCIFQRTNQHQPMQQLHPVGAAIFIVGQA